MRRADGRSTFEHSCVLRRHWHMTVRLAWDSMEGKCLATLVVGDNRVLDFSYTPCERKTHAARDHAAQLPSVCCAWPT